MSKRSEIIDGSKSAYSKYGLVYTEVLGWIDLGHAQGMNSPYNLVRTGKFITWRIRHGRPWHERQSIALAMMMTLARKFEALQATPPISFLTDSGFSGEDLVSDLLGFLSRDVCPEPLSEAASCQ